MRATLHYSGVSCGGVKVTRYTPAPAPWLDSGALSLANSDEGPEESARTVPEETMTINVPPCASQSNVTKSVLLPSRSVALVTTAMVSLASATLWHCFPHSTAPLSFPFLDLTGLSSDESLVVPLALAGVTVYSLIAMRHGLKFCCHMDAGTLQRLQHYSRISGVEVGRIILSPSH